MDITAHERMKIAKLISKCLYDPDEIKIVMELTDKKLLSEFKLTGKAKDDWFNLLSWANDREPSQVFNLIDNVYQRDTKNKYLAQAFAEMQKLKSKGGTKTQNKLKTNKEEKLKKHFYTGVTVIAVVTFLYYLILFLYSQLGPRTVTIINSNEKGIDKIVYNYSENWIRLTPKGIDKLRQDMIKNNVRKEDVKNTLSMLNIFDGVIDSSGSTSEYFTKVIKYVEPRKLLMEWLSFLIKDGYQFAREWVLLLTPKSAEPVTLVLKNTSGGIINIDNDLSSGLSYIIEIKVSKEQWHVYGYQVEDKGGKTQQIFPNPNPEIKNDPQLKEYWYEFANPISAGSHQFPPGENCFQLDESKGKEMFVLLYAQKSLPEKRIHNDILPNVKFPDRGFRFAKKPDYHVKTFVFHHK